MPLSSLDPWFLWGLPKLGRLTCFPLRLGDLRIWPFPAVLFSSENPLPGMVFLEPSQPAPQILWPLSLHVYSQELPVGPSLPVTLSSSGLGPLQQPPELISPGSLASPHQAQSLTDHCGIPFHAPLASLQSEGAETPRAQRTGESPSALLPLLHGVLSKAPPAGLPPTLGPRVSAEKSLTQHPA